MTDFFGYLPSDINNVAVSVNALSSEDATIAEVYLTLGLEDYATQGTSRRDPGDPDNPEIGAKLALGRALRQLGRELLKEGQELVRQQDRAASRQRQAAEEAAKKKAARAKAAKKALANK